MIRYTISGNAGVGSATITYTGGTTTANSSGAYSFTVAPGWSGTVTPSKTGFSFSPTSITFTNVVANQSCSKFHRQADCLSLLHQWVMRRRRPAYFATTVNDIAALNPALVLFNGDLENNGFVTTEMNPMVADLKNANLFNKTYLVRGNADDHVRRQRSPVGKLF